MCVVAVGVCLRSVTIRRDRMDLHTPIKQGNLARLLVRHGESVLEAAVAVTELIPPPLLGLDPLAADLLTAHVVAGGGGSRVEVIVVIACELVRCLGTLLLLLLAGRRTNGGGGTERVEAMRPGDSRERTRGDGGARGVRAAATTAAVRTDTVRELTSAQVGERVGVDGGGRVRTSGGARAVVTTRGSVSVLVEATRERERVETARRRRGRDWKRQSDQ